MDKKLNYKEKREYNNKKGVEMNQEAKNYPINPPYYFMNNNNNNNFYNN